MDKQPHSPPIHPERLAQAGRVIEHFDLDETRYQPLRRHKSFDIEGNKTNTVFVRDNTTEASVEIDFGRASHCRVFIGTHLRGSLKISLKYDHALVYIGNDCELNNLVLRSRQQQDFIAIGNHAFTTGKNVWISGQGCGAGLDPANPALIIGDDAFIAVDVVIRNSDAHPVYNLRTEQQVNLTAGDVVIEPHVWINERASVLKNVTIGACSIVALGAVVTKDVPRFSLAKGVPATTSSNPDLYWSRDHSDVEREKARLFMKRFSQSRE